MSNSLSVWSIKMGIVCAGMFLSGVCGLVGDIVQEHEKICRAEARTIVHDRDLWAKYVAGANESYLNRKKEFLETGRSVPEYVLGFEVRYGSELKTERVFVEGKVTRGDIFIIKDGKIVAQFVDFMARYDSLGGNTNFDCTGLFPDLYSLKSVSYE